VNELDEIMSGDSGAAPVETPVQQEQPSQPRDETGRFAPKAEEQPAAIVEPIAEAQAGQEEPHPQGGIPQARLKAEAEKRREAEADAAALRREIAELRGMVQATRQPAPQPQQEQPPASIFDDPDAFLKAQFESQITPVQKQILEMREFVSENMAVTQHGAETVEAAKQAIEQAARTPEGQQVVQKLMQSRHPFGDLVAWHKQQQAIARVGNDPDAWLNAEIEKRLSDPTEQAKIMERIRSGAASNTNRSQPLTSLPPSLSRLPAGGNAPADDDMSDGAIFSHAMR
jgi:hypothetical protein